MIDRSNPLGTDLYCLTSEEHSLGRSNIEVVRRMLSAGVKLIQYREKDKPAGQKLAECLELRRMTRDAGCAFIINDNVDLALLCDADGVHVGQDDLPVDQVRKLLGKDKIIGLSTHSPEQAVNAVNIGADYIGVGPIFATKTKKDVCDPVGFDYLEWVAKNLEIPFVAIGGIKAHNIQEVTKRGATCIAMVTEIVGQEEIEKAIHTLRNLMKSE